MKYLVISDIHGSSYYANKIRDIYERENPDKIILLGDLYYHGPKNQLTQEYDPMKVAEVLNSYKNIIMCTRGNCDAEVDEMISEFKFEEQIELTINNKKFLFQHGQVYNIDYLPKGIDVLVYGHFHTGYIQEKDGILCVNSGSISLPKNGTKNSYLIIDDENVYLKDIDGNTIDSKKYI